MKIKSLPMVALLALVLTACGGGSGTTSSATSSVAPASSVTSSQPVASSSIASSVAQTWKVTFDLNYDGKVLSTEELETGKTATKPSDPTREGYVFTGWYSDADCTTEYDFATPIKADTTIYAGWEKAVAGNTITINFYYNYEGAPDNGIFYSATINKNRKVTNPGTPFRDGYAFVNWYTEADCINVCNINAIFTADTDIYAKWQVNYTFEAEYTDFTGKQGHGFSGNNGGIDMICYDTDGSAQASNGAFVSYLYYDGCYLDFNITSSAACDNVILVARFSVEFYDMSLDSSTYTCTVNGTDITGYTLDLSGAYPVGTSGTRPFQDYTLSTSVSLVEGENLITLTTNNSNDHGGTMNADAPLVDCIKLATNDATLTWDPHTENLRN